MGIRKFFFCFLFSVLCFLIGFHKAFSFDWKEAKGDHFIVYYAGSEQFAKDVLRQSEVYYNQIASDIGYPRYSNFWQWDNRVKIYVYPTKEEYRKGSGQLDWSSGMADYVNKKILTYAQSENFLDALLPHEIAHLIFRDFVGFKGQVPLWIDEGVAQWEEPKKRALSPRVTFYLLQQRQMIPLRDLSLVRDLSRKSAQEVNFFYMESVSIVDFMIRTYGAQRFTDFCRQLRDGKNLDEAMEFAYSGSVQDLEELQNRWIKSVGEESL